MNTTKNKRLSIFISLVILLFSVNLCTVNAYEYLFDLNTEGCVNGAQLQLPYLSSDIQDSIIVTGDGREIENGSLDCTLDLQVKLSK